MSRPVRHSGTAGTVRAAGPGEGGTAWLFAFHLIPAYRHTIEVREVNPEARTIRTHEHGGILTAWDHTLHVEPTDARSCRYSDTVAIDAGRATRLVAAIAVGIYRYRHRRWHKLVRQHLLPDGPACAAQTRSAAQIWSRCSVDQAFG
ncbi:hypothetical protein MXEN_13871 [Mycobacterium xenopi RIVM700367]|nr:hypothetical protein [Mycobacterium xenopi]EID12156.1 hypothetical protein MXEN_13871 [Mycobacterium xenopi RIVM700367]